MGFGKMAVRKKCALFGHRPKEEEQAAYSDTLTTCASCEFWFRRQNHMNLREKIRETGAAGYILLWLLGIPIPILLLIFLLRGCT
jgi:hypothetical protein